MSKIPITAERALTSRLARTLSAAGTNVVMSLYEKPDESDPQDAIGFNSAITISSSGDLLMRTRKTHLPVTAGYYEDTYFSHGEDGTPMTKIKDFS